MLLRYLSWKPIVATLLLALVLGELVYLVIAGDLGNRKVQDASPPTVVASDAAGEPDSETEKDEAASVPDDSAEANAEDQSVLEGGSSPISEIQTDSDRLPIDESEPGLVSNIADLDGNESLSGGAAEATPVDAAVVERIRGSLVQLYYPSGGLAGLGVVVHREEDGFGFLTAAHILRGLSEFEVVYQHQSDTEPWREMTCQDISVEKSMPERDLAYCLAKSRLAPVEALQVHGGTSGESGASSYRVAIDSAEIPFVKQASIAGKRELQVQPEQEVMSYYVVKGKSESGVSGSPLVNSSGAIIGLASGNAAEHAFYCDEGELVSFLEECGMRLDVAQGKLVPIGK